MLLLRLTAALLLTVGISANTTAAQSSAAPASVSDTQTMHGIIPVQLAKSLDSKKLKEGQEIIATTIVTLYGPSGLLIPSDSKVIGHVTEAKARSKGDGQSSLGIVFDRIEVSKGKVLSIKGVIQALAPNPQASAGPDTGAAGSGTLAKQDGSNSATTANPAWGPGTYPGQNPGDRQVGVLLNSHSNGVVGIKNLELGNDSVVISSGKDVKLDMGSQILIKAE